MLKRTEYGDAFRLRALGECDFFFFHDGTAIGDVLLLHFKAVRLSPCADFLADVFLVEYLTPLWLSGCIYLSCCVLFQITPPPTSPPLCLLSAAFPLPSVFPRCLILPLTVRHVTILSDLYKITHFRHRALSVVQQFTCWAELQYAMFACFTIQLPKVSTVVFSHQLMRLKINPPFALSKWLEA